MKKILNLKKVNGNERIVLNLENGKGRLYCMDSDKGKRIKAEIIYDRYNGKIKMVKMAA